LAGLSTDIAMDGGGAAGSVLAARTGVGVAVVPVGVFGSVGGREAVLECPAGPGATVVGPGGGAVEVRVRVVLGGAPAVVDEAESGEVTPGAAAVAACVPSLLVIVQVVTPMPNVSPNPVRPMNILVLRWVVVGWPGRAGSDRGRSVAGSISHCPVGRISAGDNLATGTSGGHGSAGGSFLFTVSPSSRQL
jgi:hypothetical protein